MDLIVIGSGRSGTTITSHLLGAHRDLAWFSSSSSRHPTTRWPAALARVALVAPHLRRRGWPRPAEAIGAWDHYFPGFRAAERDLFAADADAGDAEGFRRFVEAHRRWQGRPHFFTKITGWPRIEFLRAVLPGVRILHVERDPRAVALSMLRQRWGGRRKHPEQFEGVDLLSFYADFYLRFYDARTAHDWSGVEVLRYEDLVADVVGTLAATCERIGLPADRGFRRRIERFAVSPDRPWGSSLEPGERDRLTALLERPVVELGYPT